MALVLVIDDDPALLKTLVSLLKAGGHTALTASTGADGLRMLKESPVDVVLVDIIMPGMNGLELMRQAATGGTKAKIIAMSGGNAGLDNDWFQEALRQGAVHALAKPFGSLELSLAIKNALSVKPRAP